MHSIHYPKLKHVQETIPFI